MRQFVLITIILAATRITAQEEPFAGISYSTIFVDKVATKDNSILNESKSMHTNLSIHALYGDSISKNWVAYGKLYYKRFNSKINMSDADKSSLQDIIPELVLCYS